MTREDVVALLERILAGETTAEAELDRLRAPAARKERERRAFTNAA